MGDDTKNCPACGEQILAVAKKCKHCGEELDGTSRKKPATGRTESSVIQVAPSYEQEKILEMESFGWSLTNRQEIHETGDSSTSADAWGGGVTKTTEVSHYVKLHFSRSLDLPNIERIHALEEEIAALQMPERGEGLSCLVIILWFFAGFFSVGLGWVVLFVKARKKRAEEDRVIQPQIDAVMERRAKLVSDIRSLLAA